MRYWLRPMSDVYRAHLLSGTLLYRGADSPHEFYLYNRWHDLSWQIRAFGYELDTNEILSESDEVSEREAAMVLFEVAK